MAGIRVVMLVVLSVLTVTLLLVPVRGVDWVPIDGAQLVSLYGGQPQSVTPSVTPSVTASDDDDGDDDSDFDFDDDEAPEDAFPPAGGGATSMDINPFSHHGVQVEFEDDPPRRWDTDSDSDTQVELVDTPLTSWDSDADADVEFVDAPPPRSWTSSTSPDSSGLEVVCTENGFHITLLVGSLSDAKIVGSKEVLSVLEAPADCGYKVSSMPNTFIVPFTGCNVNHVDGYSLQLIYHRTQVATVFCEENQKPDLSPHFTGKPKSKCNVPKPSNCAVSSGERVPCGQPGMSSADCEKMGCCVDSSTCYYPLDECTADKHFVFAIRSDSVSIPLDPSKLVIPGSPTCKPVIVNDKVAIFKFKVTECGTHAYTVGDTKIYLAEVQRFVKALNLRYGVITRDDPLRFMVECRYSKSGTPQRSLASTGFMVKIPTSGVPSSVFSNGLYGVQLKIATDQTYSKYLPINNQPLYTILGKPVYLELLLLSPKPDAVILVNYCVAYPRSAKNALVLVYEGCANPHDSHVSILQVSDLSKNRHQRRFVVKAFQFMEQKTNKYLNEEIYFMCSTEVCRPDEKTCAERCFDGKAS